MGEYGRRMKVKKINDGLDIALRILAIVALLMVISSVIYVTWVKLCHQRKSSGRR